MSYRRGKPPWHPAAPRLTVLLRFRVQATPLRSMARHDRRAKAASAKGMINQSRSKTLNASPSLFVLVAWCFFLFSPATPVKATTPAMLPIIEGANTIEGKPVMAKMESTIIPQIDFQESDVATVIDFLNTRCKQLDPGPTRLKFRLDLPPASDAKPLTIHRKVHITLTGAPISELLLYVITQTKLDCRIEKGVVVLFPHVPY